MCVETCSRFPIPVDIVRKPAVVAVVVDNDGSLTSESDVVVTARLGYLGVSLREPPPPVIVVIVVVDVIVVVVVIIDAAAPFAVVVDDVVVIVDDRAREEASAAWSASPSML